ncbi:EVI2A protein, partial [Onychorhynchus coronatus]|nr:EVI2A protein [Onychorhynchus coronatus]
MKTKRSSNPCLALPVTVIFSLCLQTSANHTSHLRVREETWNPISQNPPGSHNRTEANTNSPLSINFSSKISTFKMQSTLQPFSSSTAQNPTSSPATSAASATGGARNTTKPKRPTTKETCEDDKSLVLICFIIIAVLVLICTFLLLSTVVIANKLSHLKRTQQGKRRPRSNGDIVATTSLWPTTPGTWQRVPKGSAGTELIRQDLLSGRDTRNRTKTQGEEPTTATDNAQENKEPSQSHKPILTNFVVEI